MCKDLCACAGILSVQVKEKDEELQCSEPDVARLDRECWSEENGLGSVMKFRFWDHGFMQISWAAFSGIAFDLFCPDSKCKSAHRSLGA